MFSELITYYFSNLSLNDSLTYMPNLSLTRGNYILKTGSQIPESKSTVINKRPAWNLSHGGSRAKTTLYSLISFNSLSLSMYRADSKRNIIVTLPQKLLEDYNKGKVVPVQAMKTYRKYRGMTPLILNLGSIYGRVVTFMLQQLYHWERTPNPGTHIMPMFV